MRVAQAEEDAHLAALQRGDPSSTPEEDVAQGGDHRAIEAEVREAEGGGGEGAPLSRTSLHMTLPLGTVALAHGPLMSDCPERQRRYPRVRFASCASAAPEHGCAAVHADVANVQGDELGGATARIQQRQGQVMAETIQLLGAEVHGLSRTGRASGGR